MESEISVSFTLTGIDLHPSEITEKLKINPTATWKKGDLVDPRAKIRYQKNGWKLSSTLANSLELDEYIKSIFNAFKSVWETLVELCSCYEAEISCVIYVDNQVPAIHFNQDILQEINQLNAEIDIDIYVLPESNERINSQKLQDGKIEAIFKY